MTEVSSAKQRYDQIPAELAAIAPVETGHMFGKACLKSEGKAFAAFFQESMVFKLSGDHHARALSLSGSQLWDPSGKHRPMKGWVQVSFAHSELWPDLARQALGNLSSKS